VDGWSFHDRFLVIRLLRRISAGVARVTWGSHGAKAIITSASSSSVCRPSASTKAATTLNASIATSRSRIVGDSRVSAGVSSVTNRRTGSRNMDGGAPGTAPVSTIPPPSAPGARPAETDGAFTRSGPFVVPQTTFDPRPLTK
jgi:hypothetical protein